MAALATTATLLTPLRSGTAGDRDIVVTWTLATPSEYEVTVALTQNTTTAVALPTGATIVIVIPPTTNTQQIRIDDASGKKLGLTTPFVIPVDGDTTLTLHLAAGSNQTVRVICL